MPTKDDAKGPSPLRTRLAEIDSAAAMMELAKLPGDPAIVRQCLAPIQHWLEAAGLSKR
jgi:hypothetical protein